MTFKNILDELCAGAYCRFDANQTASATYWINNAYGEIWSSSHWPWKQTAISQTVTLTAGARSSGVWNIASGSGSMEYLKLAYIQDDLGNPLDYVDPMAFLKLGRARNTVVAGESAGRPTTFSLWGGTIVFDPIPDASYSFSAVFERNTFVRTSALAYKAGVWDGSTNTDVPAWDEPFQYLIFLGALAVGLLSENDPGYGDARTMFLQQLEGMKQHYVLGYRPNGQLGLDPL